MGVHACLVSHLHKYTQHTHTQAETASLMEQRMAYEAKLSELEAQVASLNQNVKQANERSAKLRAHCDR